MKQNTGGFPRTPPNKKTTNVQPMKKRIQPTDPENLTDFFGITADKLRHIYNI